MVIEAAPSASLIETGVGDFCPIVPAACIFKGGEAVIDKVNPFKSFWDSFFVSTPEESLRAPLELIWQIPRFNFDEDWFRDLYANNLVIIGIAASIVVLVTTLMVAAMTRQGNGIVNATADWLFTMVQVVCMPMLSAAILWISATAGLGALAGVDITSPDSYLGFFDAAFFGVGWMSLFARLIGILMMVEIVVVYLIQVLATLSAPLVVPIRSIGNFGASLYARMIRGILLGFVPLIMSLILTLGVLVLQKVDDFGAQQRLFEFVGALFTLLLAAVLPLVASRTSREFVHKQAYKLAATRAPSLTRRSSGESPSSSSLENYMERRQQRRAQRGKLLRDASKVALAGATGGSSAAVSATGTAVVSSGKTKKGVEAFRRSRAFKDQSTSK